MSTTQGAIEEECERRRKRPHGKQEYKGNGKHEWEIVTGHGTHRLRVPGGWLYATQFGALVFVPVPDAVGYAV